MIAIGISESLNRLMELQKELDKQIIEGRGLQGRNLLPMRVLALQVEIAELAQEVSDAWKFWKSPKPRDQKKVLEELVDCLHFLLSIGLAIEVDPYEMPYKVYRRMDLIDQFHAMFDMAGIAYVPNQWHWTMSVYLGLCDMLGFTWDEVERAYLAKNEINLARQEQGY